MPRIIREIHEYYQNRIVNGLYSQVLSLVTSGDTLRITAGAAVINKTLVTLGTNFDIAANTFIVDENAKARVDIVVLKSTGAIEVIHGNAGEISAPACPENAITLAQISLVPSWTHFIGKGVHDEVISIRSQHVIDTRFVA